MLPEYILGLDLTYVFYVDIGIFMRFTKFILGLGFDNSCFHSLVAVTLLHEDSYCFRKQVLDSNIFFMTNIPQKVYNAVKKLHQRKS